MKNFLSIFSLFTSMGTLICCALPALFVALGAGAAFAGLVTKVPGLVWISENKLGVFTLAGFFLVIAGMAQRRAKLAPCPLDPELAQICTQARKMSQRIYFASLVVFVIGVSFSVVTSLFFES